MNGCESPAQARLRFLRLLCYCGRDHFEQDARRRQQVMAFHMIPEELVIVWGDEFVFEEIKSFEGALPEKVAKNVKSKHATNKRNKA